MQTTTSLRAAKQPQSMQSKLNAKLAQLPFCEDVLWTVEKHAAATLIQACYRGYHSRIYDDMPELVDHAVFFEQQSGGTVHAHLLLWDEVFST